MEISQDCNTLYLTDIGILPQTDTTMKLVVMPRSTAQIRELVENWRVENKRLRAIVNNTDIETIARKLGFDIGSEGVVRLEQGVVILARRSHDFLIDWDSSLETLLEEHFQFSLVVGG